MISVLASFGTVCRFRMGLEYQGVIFGLIGSARDMGAALILKNNGWRCIASYCVAISPSVELDASSS